MNRKLLFFDIDGTLLSENGIPESTRKALAEARKRGCMLFVNTGRTKVSIPSQVKKLDFDGYICGCGTNIYYKEEKLFSSRITNARCREIALRIRKMDLPVFYEADDAIYFDYKSAESDPWISHAKKAFETEGKDLKELLSSEDLVFDKILMILKPSEEGEKLKEFLSRDFVCIDRLNDMWEITQKSCSKGTGIQFLCSHLGVSPEDCYVFGDSENDRSMLEAVPNSVVMGNGEASVKQCCSYVTADLEDDGIWKAMEHFELV